jgi:uncharacterized protein YbcI
MAFEVAMQDASTNGGVTGETRARISTGLVRVYARHCGKRPTRAITHIAGDTVVCVFRDAYPPGERTLLDFGEVETVGRMRAAFNRVMEADSRRVIEENCGRRVIACLAATHVDPDIAVEIFVLEGDSSPLEASEAVRG